MGVRVLVSLRGRRRVERLAGVWGCGRGGLGCFWLSWCSAVVLRPGRSAIVRRDSRSGGAHARQDRTQRFGTQRFGVRGGAFGARARRFCRGGGSRALARRVVRLPLVALLLAALVAAILAASRPAAVAVAQTGPVGSEEAWSATLIPQQTSGTSLGCTGEGTDRCALHLTPPTLRIGSTTYRVTSVSVGGAGLAITTTPPPAGRSGQGLAIGNRDANEHARWGFPHFRDSDAEPLDAGPTGNDHAVQASRGSRSRGRAETGQPLRRMRLTRPARLTG